MYVNNRLTGLRCSPPSEVLNNVKIRFWLPGRFVAAGFRVIARHRPARARIASRLARPRVGAFWKPGDPALMSLPGPAWLGAR
jgi:hypothetical protein